MIDEYGSHFRYLAHIDPWDGIEQNQAEIKKYVMDGHASGIIVEPSMKFIKSPLKADDQEMMYPIYDFCEKNDILVTITFGGLWTSSVDNYQPIHADSLAKDFPKMRVVLAHGGWPYTAQICHVAYQRGNVYLSPELYALGDMQPDGHDYMAAANHWLQEHVIFATGIAYPNLDSKDMLKMTIDAYKNELNEQARDKVLYHNASSLLGLESKRPIVNVLGDKA